MKQKWINWRSIIIDDESLSFHAKALALYLNTYMNDSHDMAFPSVERIRGEMSLGSNKTVIKYLKELCEAGYLDKQRRFSKSNIYTAIVPKKITHSSVSGASNVPHTLLYDVHDSSVPRTLAVLHDVHTNKQENKQSNKQVGRMARPTIEEIHNYIVEKNYSFSAEAFHAFYESNGWKVGKNPMKSWKSACVTWQKRNETNQRNNKNSKEDPLGSNDTSWADGLTIRR